VPTAANAGFYAQIVAEKAILRRLVEAGTRIVQLGYGGNEGDGGDGEVVDRAQGCRRRRTRSRSRAPVRSRRPSRHCCTPGSLTAAVEQPTTRGS